MELINDDLFQPFEKDGIEDLGSVKAGGIWSGKRVYGNCSVVHICEGDYDGYGFACKEYAIEGYGCQ